MTIQIQIKITDDNDREHPSLLGVFQRKYPFAVLAARTRPYPVTHGGVRYTVAPVQVTKEEVATVAPV